jgi:hypothetical protein
MKYLRMEKNVLLTQSTNSIFCLHVYKYAFYLLPKFRLFNVKIQILTHDKIFKISYRGGVKKWL